MSADPNQNPSKPATNGDSGQVTKANGDEHVDPVKAIRLAGEILTYASELPGIAYRLTDGTVADPRRNELSSRLDMIDALSDELCVAAGVKTTTWKELYFRTTAIIQQMKRNEQLQCERKEVVVVEVPRYPDWLLTASIFAVGIAIGIMVMQLIHN